MHSILHPCTLLIACYHAMSRYPTDSMPYMWFPRYLTDSMPVCYIQVAYWQHSQHTDSMPSMPCLFDLSSGLLFWQTKSFKRPVSCMESETGLTGCKMHINNITRGSRTLPISASCFAFSSQLTFFCQFRFSQNVKVTLRINVQTKYNRFLRIQDVPTSDIWLSSDAIR